MIKFRFWYIHHNLIIDPVKFEWNSISISVPSQDSKYKYFSPHFCYAKTNRNHYRQCIYGNPNHCPLYIKTRGILQKNFLLFSFPNPLGLSLAFRDSITNISLHFCSGRRKTEFIIDTHMQWSESLPPLHKKRGDSSKDLYLFMSEFSTFST